MPTLPISAAMTIADWERRQAAPSGYWEHLNACDIARELTMYGTQAGISPRNRLDWVHWKKEEERWAKRAFSQPLSCYD
jgi:hypothetical protein